MVRKSVVFRKKQNIFGLPKFRLLITIIFHVFSLIMILSIYYHYQRINIVSCKYDSSNN